MPNIFDYLEWRGDVPFSADPFNDVDGLVLAELAYTLFDGIVPEDGEKISLGQVREEFFRDHKRESLMRSEKHFDRAPLLMDGMMSSATEAFILHSAAQTARLSDGKKTST